MAQHLYRLLEQGVGSGYAPFAGMETGNEFEHDFYNPDTGLNHEQAVIAAGWVERVDQDESKGGKR